MSGARQCVIGSVVLGIVGRGAILGVAQTPTRRVRLDISVRQCHATAVNTGDIIAADLRVLFVAINPPPSAANGRAPFATPSNGFWPLLHAAGLTPRLFLPSESGRLLDERLGLVSMVQRSTAAASELRAKELRAGAKRLAAIVEQWHPRTIALLGVTLLPFVLPEHDEPGPGLKRPAFHGARVFVLPNPSGRNLAFPGVAGKLPWYRELASSA